MRIRDCLKLFPCFGRRNGERQLCGLKPDLHVRKIEQFKEQAALIAFSCLQLIGNIHHLLEQPIEFCNLAAKKRSILCHADLCESLDKITGCHIGQLDPLHGQSTHSALPFQTLKSVKDNVAKVVCDGSIAVNSQSAVGSHFGTNEPFSSPSSRNPALTDGGVIPESRTDCRAFLARSGTIVSSELAAINRTCAFS